MINEFKCLTCGNKFEFLKIRSDEKVQDDGCTKCGEKDPKKLEKQFPKKGSFQLKGRGWFDSGGY